MYVYVVDSKRFEVKRRHVCADVGLYWNVNLHNMFLMLAKDGTECPSPHFPYRAFESKEEAVKLCNELKTNNKK